MTSRCDGGAGAHQRGPDGLGEASWTLQSPLGPLTIRAQAGALTHLSWGQAALSSAPSDEVLSEAARQLSAYFAGNLQAFDLPLAPPGSKLQQAVCAEMSAIPFGETRTYGDISRALGVPAQAIGQACGGNPIPIVIPCHRVLSATGLGGFSGEGGVETKVWLLRHEGAAGLLI